MRLLLFLLVITAQGSVLAQDSNPQRQALQTASAVADKLIRDSRFGFKMVAQKEELGMQVVDFRKNITQKKQVAYATRQLMANADTTVQLGINSGGRVTIWINEQMVFRQTKDKLVVPVEEAYGRFVFSDAFRVKLKKGKNGVRIRYESTGTQPVVFLRPVTETLDLDLSVKFDSSRQASWLVMGPFSAKDTNIVSGSGDLPAFVIRNGQAFSWEKWPQRIIPELWIDSTLTYYRDPYVDWNYSNGNTVWSLLPLAKASGDNKYLNYVKRYTSFLLENRDYFEKQYDSMFVFRGSFHRLFRMTMLDDAGSAVLPYIELALTEKDPSLQKVIAPVAEYILNKQVRLKDGTYCRPEPTKFTVWADDLFMSVPFLLRMGKISGKPSYFDSAAIQFTRFRKYLLNTENGLYQHGWFSQTQKQAPVAWGRANGWIAWSTAELLSGLPVTHPQYQNVLTSFREQVATLIKYQAADGMWHQVLNNPASYKETSCTAMFTLVMARGVREGWIDAKYKENALRGWNAVKAKIDADGTVHGICRGTEIGMDEAFYFDRRIFDQDPRGLGAVITAGVEISRLK